MAAAAAGDEDLRNAETGCEVMHDVQVARQRPASLSAVPDPCVVVVVLRYPEATAFQPRARAHTCYLMRMSSGISILVVWQVASRSACGRASRGLRSRAQPQAL